MGKVSVDSNEAGKAKGCSGLTFLDPRKQQKHLLHYVLNILEIHAELRRILERNIFWPSILIPTFIFERMEYS